MSRRNLVDRAVGYFSPEAGLRRSVARVRGNALAAVDLTADRSETRWRGASRTLRSMTKWVPRIGSAYTDTPPRERADMIGRSFDAYRNHMLARAVITRMRTNVVGTGLMAHATVDSDVLGITADQADELNAVIDGAFTTWADNPVEVDVEATLDFAGLQSTAVLAAMLSGDCFANSPFVRHPHHQWGLKVQLVDGMRVSNPQNRPDTPTLVQGIETDTVGFPLRHWMRRRHPADPLDPIGANTWDAIPVFGPRTGRRRSMHIWNDKDRIGMVRGTPMLAPVLEPLQQLEVYDRAEIFAAVSQALITFAIETPAEVGEDGFPQPVMPGTTDEEPDAGAGQPRYEMGYGAAVELPTGAKLNMQQPSRPNAQFDPFFLSVCKRFSAALEIPVDEVLLAYNTSYSAARAAMLAAYRVYTMRRWWLVQQFCQPFRLLWFDEAVARGLIDGISNYADPVRRAAYTQCMWIGPARGSMDEYKEAQAAEKRIQIGVSNETIETAAMQGEAWRNVHHTRVRERRVAMRDSVRTNPRAGGGNPPPEPPPEPPPAPAPAPGSEEEEAEDA